MNKVLGTITCPMAYCRQPGAEVREGEKGAPYVICDACSTMIRTQSRLGKTALRELVTPAPAPVKKDEKPAPAKKDEKPAAKPAPKKDEKPAPEKETAAVAGEGRPWWSPR
jgi:hypothetical protein